MNERPKSLRHAGLNLINVGVICDADELRFSRGGTSGLKIQRMASPQITTVYLQQHITNKLYDGSLEAASLISLPFPRKHSSGSSKDLSHGDTCPANRQKKGPRGQTRETPTKRK